MIRFLLNNKWHALLVLASIVLIYISPLTSAARAYVGESIGTSITLFAIARTINAGVSVLQSAQASALFASLNVGEVLDPLNDMIENFSTVVTWAIGALFGQTFALDLAELVPFGTIVALLGVSSLLFRAGGSHQASATLWFLFQTLFLARVALVLSIYTSMWLSQAIIDTRIADTGPQLDQFSRDVGEMTGIVAIEVPGDDEIGVMRSGLDAAEDSIENFRLELSRLEDERANLVSRTGWTVYIPGMSTEEIRTLEAKIEEVQARISLWSGEVERARYDLECIEMQKQGGSCQSTLDRLKNIDVSKVSDVASAGAGMINSLLLLSAALLFKCVFMPIISGMVLLRLVQPAAGVVRQWTGFDRSDSVTAQLTKN